MDIALAQLDFHIGNFEHNLKKIFDSIKYAIAGKADLIVFSEMAVCGYPPYDLIEFDVFIEKCVSSINKICAYSNDIAIIIGSPVKNEEASGKPFYNAALFIHEGKIKNIIKKTLIPDYDIFDEYRYFEPNKDFNLVEFKGHKIALTICEDIWNVATPLYHTSPLEKLVPQGANIIINISASPFSYSHNARRLEVLRKNSEKYKLPLFYVNQVGAQTELIFDGGSAVFSANGLLYDQLPLFEEKVRIFNLQKVNQAGKSAITHAIPKPELIYSALVTGIKDYFIKSGLTSAILGLSGGIDSAVTAVLLVHALGNKNVTALLLPSPYSSDHSVKDATELAENLGIKYEKVSITGIFHEYLEMLKTYFKGFKEDITEENLQARIRAGILMAFSNKFGNILINTSNKSEIATGYGTLYGDMCGGLSVLGDVYKTEVYELAGFINKDTMVIPQNIIIKAPSAELKHDQKDSDSLPEYPVLDKILFQFIEEKKGLKEIVRSGFDEKLVSQVLKMVHKSEYKRKQTAPVLRVSEKAFGTGRRIPIVSRLDI